MTDDADDIAADVLKQLREDDRVGFKTIVAAALRAYGASQRNSMIEEIASGIGDDGHVDGAYLRSLKSTPESKP